MAIYKTLDLIKELRLVLDDGFEFVELMELESEDDMPASVSLSGIGEDEMIEYDPVESCEIPDDYDYDNPDFRFKPNDQCEHIAFTFDELRVIQHSVNNALEYYKECIKDDFYEKDVREHIRKSTIDTRNFQAKLAKMLKNFKPV